MIGINIFHHYDGIYFAAKQTKQIQAIHENWPPQNLIIPQYWTLMVQSFLAVKYEIPLGFLIKSQWKRGLKYYDYNNLNPSLSYLNWKDN